MAATSNSALRALTRDEVPLLRPCLEGLAAHHNRVATSFQGVYPTMPVDTHLLHMGEHIEHDTARIVGYFSPDGGLRGFGMASYEGTYGEIDYLFLEESLRGGGIGGEMLERLMGYLREKGVRFVDLKVVLGNPAKRFYEKYGFSPRTEVLSKQI